MTSLILEIYVVSGLDLSVQSGSTDLWQRRQWHMAVYLTGIKERKVEHLTFPGRAETLIQQYTRLSSTFRTCRNCFPERGSSSCSLLGLNLAVSEPWWCGGRTVISGSVLQHVAWAPFSGQPLLSVSMGKVVLGGDFRWCSSWPRS